MAHEGNSANIKFICYTYVGREKTMALNVCRYCRKVFRTAVKTNVCEECRTIDNELFEKIEDYLKKYPNSNAIQISQGLQITAPQVIAFIDEGRLVISKGKFEPVEKKR